MRDNDLMGEVLSSHTGVLNRRKIDSALVENGYTLPLPNKVSFHLFNGADMYMVTRNNGNKNEYWFEEI